MGARWGFAPLTFWMPSVSRPCPPITPGPEVLSQTRILGELHHAIAAGQVAPDTDFPTLGEIIAGQAKGRTSPADLTLADLTGTGVQDTAIATLARRRAEAANAGSRFST